MATAVLISHLSSFLGLPILFSWRVRQPLVWQLVPQVFVLPTRVFLACSFTHEHQLSVEVPPGSANSPAMAPAPFMAQLLPAPSTSCLAALASPAWARSPGAFSPQGGSGPHYSGYSTNHLLSEPVMMFWLSCLYKQRQFGYRGTNPPEIQRFQV